MRLTKILSAAGLTYSTYDGAIWSAYETIPDLLIDSTGNFVSPICSGLRLRYTFAVATSVDRIQITRLSKTSGLTFQATSGDGTTQVECYPATAQVDNPLSGSTANEVVRFAEQSDEVYELEITGLSAETLSFKSTMVGVSGWSPSQFNYDYGQGIDDGAVLSISESLNSAISEKQDGKRKEEMQFALAPKSDSDGLTRFLKFDTVDGLCLFERSIADYNDCYLAIVQTQGGRHDSFERYSFGLNILEKHECL